MRRNHKPSQPVHVPGTIRGEELAIRRGKEPGRGNKPFYRSARDATGINAQDSQPIDPAVPNIPPT
jgi:hypothetical protein